MFIVNNQNLERSPAPSLLILSSLSVMSFFIKISFILKILFLVSISCFAQEIEFIQTQAQKGDGVFKILDRYQIKGNKCNIKKFYSINKLKKKSTIKIGKTYYLPIYNYAYDGKSIRTTIGIDDWDRAVRIKQFNESLRQAGVKSGGSYDKSKILWVPHHELDCKTPAAAIVMDNKNVGEKKNKAGEYPIFGKNHKKLKSISKKLKGKVFYIVGGHGGPDPGAVGKRSGKNLCEDEYAYDVALRLTKKLMENGATAYMITRDANDGIRSGEILPCDSDEYCWKNLQIPRSQKPRLFQRSNAINQLYEKHKKLGQHQQYAVVIHVDSRSKGERIDVFFYHHPNSNKGKKLVETLHGTIAKNYKKYQPKRGYKGVVKARDLHMLRETTPTTAFIELGNIRNKNDQKRFILEANREALAKWLYEGLEKATLKK